MYYLQEENRLILLLFHFTLVSAKNPHKCDAQTIPANVAAPSTPFWLELSFKSHCNTGSA